MKRKSNAFHLFCASATLMVSIGVLAQENRFYFKGDLGGSLTEGTYVKGDLYSPFGGPTVARIKFEPGARVGFAAGYQLTDWFAAEAQLGTMVNPIQRELESLLFITQRGLLYMHDA